MLFVPNLGYNEFSFGCAGLAMDVAVVVALASKAEARIGASGAVSAASGEV